MKSVLLLSFSLVPFYGWLNWGVEVIRDLEAVSQCQSWDVHSRRGMRWGDQKKTWLLTSQSWERKYITLTHTHTHTHTHVHTHRHIIEAIV